MMMMMWQAKVIFFFENFTKYCKLLTNNNMTQIAQILFTKNDFG